MTRRERGAHVDRRRLLQYGTMAGLAAAAPVVRPVPARGAPSSVGGVTHHVLEGLPAADHTPSGVALAAPVSTPTFSAVSVELPQGAHGVHVRSHQRPGWSSWRWLPAASDHAPDPGPIEPLGRPRRISALLWASAADGLQVAVPGGGGTAPLRVHLVDTRPEPVDVVAGLVGDTLARVRDLLPPPDGPDAPARPDIVRRDEWGADESWRRAGPRYARPKRAIVHHTATSNAYGRGEVPAIVRSIYHYHTRVRGWNDIGYNFLVDRFGRVFEGRHGGIGRGVVGAHARGHNTGSVGVAVLGSHQDAPAARAVEDAVAALLAWKYHVHDVPPGASHRVRHDGRSYPATCGHRDVGRTSCPGRHLHDRLPAIRRQVERRS